MNTNKSRLRPVVLAIALRFLVGTAHSQGPPGIGGVGDDVNDEAPLSSLVVLGLAAGAVFGVRKLK
jgi:hypothetical protein